MKIEVHKKTLFGQTKQVRGGLSMFVCDGQAYATWHALETMRPTHRIAVNDALAEQVLGVTRRPCPHIGEQPVYSALGTKSGYTCRDRTMGEDCNTIERCSVCGYFTLYSGNPAFRAAMTNNYGVDGHPERTYLAMGDATTATFDEADSLNGMLVPSNKAGRIVVCLGGLWSTEKIASEFRGTTFTPRHNNVYTIVVQPSE